MMKHKNEYETIWKRFPYPTEIVDLSRRRTAGLLKYHVLGVTPLAKVIQSAYLQGIVDAAETLPEAKEAKRGDTTD